MALNEIAKHFYEKEIDRLLDSEDRNIIKEKFLDMRSSIDDLYVELGERARRISELESELERSREYTETLRRMLGLRSAKENIELANKLYELNFEVPDDEEPLPFSSDEYKEDRIDKIEKVVLGIQSFLKKETEQKIKELEEEQKRLMREEAYQRFISNLVRPLKP